MTDTPREVEQVESLTPDDAAADWLVRQDRGFTPSETVRFSAWLSASAANAAAWRRAEMLWASFDAEPDVLLSGMRESALKARPSLDARWGRGLIAASMAAAVVLAGWVGWRDLGMQRSGRDPDQQTLASAAPRADYSTGVGMRSDALLPDGSRVTLDSNSAIAVAYTTARRDVRLLRGQAYFSDTHDAGRPFTVIAGERTVTAVGTAFDVRLGQQVVSVVLASGSVFVSQTNGSGHSVRLSPGQEFQAAPGQAGVVSRVDVDRALAWRTGYLEFKDEPLVKAVAEMDSYGGKPISIGDPTIQELRVTGRFRIGDPARFARTLTAVYPLRVVSRGGSDLVLVRR